MGCLDFRKAIIRLQWPLMPVIQLMPVSYFLLLFFLLLENSPNANIVCIYSLIAGYQAPLFQAAPAYANVAPVAHHQPAGHQVIPVQHTHTFQRVTENFPIHAHRTIVKTIPVDRPIPQVRRTLSLFTTSIL